MGTVTISAVWVDELAIGCSDEDFSSLRLEDCIVQTLDVNPPLDASRTPHFVRCEVGSAKGVSSWGDVPQGCFTNCGVAAFSETTNTNQAILRMKLPLPARVGLTILKKLYLQRGSGRKDSALRRGLDTEAQGHVDAVLRVLQGERLAIEGRMGKQVGWLPVRGARARAQSILATAWER